MELTEQFKKLMDTYADVFTEITLRDGWWMEDYSLWVTDYEAWSIEDMRYIVDNYKDKGDWNHLRNEISKWLDYISDCGEFHIQYINLQSWLKGAPRMSNAERKSLHKAKGSYDKLIGETQERFGKMKDYDMPEHLAKPTMVVFAVLDGKEQPELLRVFPTLESAKQFVWDEDMYIEKYNLFTGEYANVNWSLVNGEWKETRI